MTLDRRNVLSAGLAAGLAAGAATAGARPAEARARAQADAALDLVPGSPIDQGPVLQAALDAATGRGAPLVLPAGRYRIGALELRAGARLIGAAGATTLEFAGGGAFITADHADGILLEGLVLDGAYQALDDGRAEGLVSLRNCRGVRLHRLTVTRSPSNGISLIACAGSVTDCTVNAVIQAAIRSVDAAGLEIAHNDIADCGNNGIQVWRSERRRGRQHRRRQPHRAHPGRRRRHRRERQRRQRFPRRRRAGLRQPHHRLRLQRRARQRIVRHPDRSPIRARASARSPSTPSSVSKAR